MLNAPLNGAIFFVFLAAIPIAFALNIVVRSLYRKAIQRAMLRHSDILEGEFPEPDRITHQSRNLEFVEIPKSKNLFRWALSMRYLFAGFAHGFSALVVYFTLEEIDFNWWRVLIVGMVLSWPVIPFSLYVAGSNRHIMFLVTLIWTVMLWLAEPESFGLILWLVGPAIISALVLANRFFRTTAIVIYLIAIAIILPLLFSLDIALALVLSLGTLALPISIFLVLTFGGLFALIVSRFFGYITNHASDLMLQADALWLMLTLWQIIQLSGSHSIGSLLMVIPFVVYRLAFLILPSKQPKDAPPLLLLLRVFGHQKSQEQLSAGLLTDWRQKGPVMLIGAADLATETFDPAELSAFLSWSTDTLFIKSPEELGAAINEAQTPAHDGLYQMQDYYCHDNSWRPTVKILMARASQVILDLRDFTGERTGVKYEIQQLVRLVPTENIRILYDTMENLGLAKEMFNYEWAKLDTTSLSGNATVYVQAA